MKLGPLSELKKKNMMTSRTINGNFLCENYYVTVIFLIFGYYGAIQISNSGYMVHIFQFFINKIFSLNEHDKQN